MALLYKKERIPTKRDTKMISMQRPMRQQNIFCNLKLSTTGL